MFDFDSYSKYDKEHRAIVGYIKKRINVNINKYRDGNDSSSFTTSGWDINGIGIAFNHKQIPPAEMTKLKRLMSKSDKYRMAEGGAWFSFILPK